MSQLLKFKVVRQPSIEPCTKSIVAEYEWHVLPQKFDKIVIGGLIYTVAYRTFDPEKKITEVVVT